MILLLGTLRTAHIWDFATYFVLLVVGWGVVLYQRRGRLDWPMAVSIVAMAAVLWFFSSLLFRPFWARYGAYYTSFVPWTGERTRVGEFLIINGLFVFVLTSYLIGEAFGRGAPERPLRLAGLAWRYWDRLPLLVRRLRLLGGRTGEQRGDGPSATDSPSAEQPLQAGFRTPAGQHKERTSPGRGTAYRTPTRGSLPLLLGGGLLLLLLELYLHLPVASAPEPPVEPSLLLRLRGQPLLGWLVLLAVLGAILLFRRREQAETRFATLLILAGLGISGFVELWVLQGDIARMNTSFRFYFQVWVLWGIASAIVLPRLWRRMQSWSRVARSTWRVALFVLVGLCALYPLTATPDKVRDRFPNTTQGRGLDGEAFMQTDVYPDANGPIVLAEDAGAMRWLEENTAGSPVILEGNTPTYRWGSRFSIYTGLPTVIGWDGHQRQQRAAVEGDVIGQRLNDVATLYNSTNIPTTLDLLRKYRISYVVVGQLERYYYAAAGLEKFEQMVGAYLERVYPAETAGPAPLQEGTLIYQVLPAVWEP
jgi:uncharacterized membrane protein